MLVQSASKNKIGWNDNLEQEYNSRIENFSKKFFLGNANCSNVGLFFMIRDLIDIDKSTNLREEILNKYIDGTALYPDELRYLTLTSPTLNKFLDKKEYQKQVNFLDPELIERIEFELVNRILLCYQQTKAILMSDRKAFLSKKMKEDQKKPFFSTVKNEAHDKELFHNTQLGKVLSTKLRGFSKADNQPSDIIKAFTKNKADNTNFMKRLKKHNTNTNEFYSLFYGKISKTDYLQKFHPNSAIMMESKFEKTHGNKNQDEPGDGLHFKGHVNTKGVVYSMAQHKKDYRTMPKVQKFISLYSGGPEANGIRCVRTKALMNRAAVTIQSWFRKLMAIRIGR